MRSSHSNNGQTGQEVAITGLTISVSQLNNGYGSGGCLSVKAFSILSSLFSMASSLSSICLRSLPASSAGTVGKGVGDGHLHSSGLSGRLGVGTGGRYAAFSSPLLLLNFHPQNSLMQFGVIKPLPRCYPSATSLFCNLP